MKNSDLKSMSVDELWKLHESLVAELNDKMAAERAMLEDRLRRLGSGVTRSDANGERRPYPKVLPKYRNPKNGGETWAGRGKQPRWLADQLRSGKKLDDFLISKAPATARIVPAQC
jgi:DNA-binding protein H-NS